MYIPISYSSGQAVNRAMMQQMETNVREHLHGVDSVSNVYNGILLSSVINSPNNIAHTFTTQNTFNIVSEALFTLANNGVDKFSINYRGDITSKSQTRANWSVQTIAPTTWTQVWVNPTAQYGFDRLGNDVRSGGNFYAPNSAYYQVNATVNLEKVSGGTFPPFFTQKMLLKKNSYQYGEETVTLVIYDTYMAKLACSALILLNKNDIVNLFVRHDCSSYVQIRTADLQIYEVP